MNAALKDLFEIAVKGIVEVEKYRIDREFTKQTVLAAVEKQAVDDDRDAITLEAKVAMLNQQMGFGREDSDDEIR